MTHSNVLLITSDQHNPFVAGYANDPLAQTPTLDRLAEQGTVFDAAYTNSPICMPARAALATGRYASTIDSFDNGSPYAGAPVSSWGHRLQAKGRPAVTFGKLHFDPEADSGFDARLPLHAKKGYSGALQGWARGDAPPNRVMVAHALDARAGEFEYTAYDRHTTRSACRWLTADAPPDRPWAAHVSYAYPHYPFRAPADLLPDDSLDVPLPPAWDRQDWPDNAELNAHRWLMGIDQRPLDEDELRNLRRVYSAMVGFLDQQIATVLRALDASGHRERTVVLYTSDHGDMLGSHGILMKSVMYDGSARVPMIMQGPDIAAGAVCSTAVSLADVFPTALEATGSTADSGSPEADRDDDLPGTSLLKIAGSSNDDARVAFSEYHGPASSGASYLVRRGDWKYVHHSLHGAAPQLFNVRADPDELHDRIGDDTVSAVRAELQNELRAIVDPDGLDATVRASQRSQLEQAGGLPQRPRAQRSMPEQSGSEANAELPRTDHGVIALGWTVPPPEIMDEVAAASGG